jgi:hypothetical protein
MVDGRDGSLALRETAGMKIADLRGFASEPKPHSPKVARLRELGHDMHCLTTHGGYRPAVYARAVRK